MKTWFDWIPAFAGMTNVKLFDFLDPVSWHGVTVVCHSRHTGESRYPVKKGSPSPIVRHPVPRHGVQPFNRHTGAYPKGHKRRYPAN